MTLAIAILATFLVLVVLLPLAVVRLVQGAGAERRGAADGARHGQMNGTAPKLEWKAQAWVAGDYKIFEWRKEKPFTCYRRGPNDIDFKIILSLPDFPTFAEAQAAAQQHADNLRADKMVEMTRRAI